MERFVDLDEISDGKKYHSQDMVKIACNDCAGCHSCCQNMDKLIILDPYDIYRLTNGGDYSFEQLLVENVELMVDRMLILPALKMNSKTGSCSFLNENNRCSIHSKRPGICRLFPLGRAYEDESFFYFYQKDECDYKNKSKVKIKNWLDTPDLPRYEKYICDWHYFIKDVQSLFEKLEDDEIKKINMFLLQNFFILKYEKAFYEDFYKRLSSVNEYIKRYYYEQM